MTPELHPLPDPLPSGLRWAHNQRRMAWLFDGDTCVGSLGFGGYGRASGLTSRGVWHLHRRGVLHLGVQMNPADGRHPPMVMRQSCSVEGALDLPDGEPVEWRPVGTNGHEWAFRRAKDGAPMLTFRSTGLLPAETTVSVEPAARELADPAPLLMLGAFLVRLALDDNDVIAGA